MTEPLATRILRDRLNHTRNGLSGQPTAIVIIPPRSGTQTPTIATARPITIAIAKTPPRTQIPTPIATPSTTPIATPAAPASTSTPTGPPPARYLYPSTTRDKLNHTLNGLAIGPKLVQPTTTATTPPGMQLPTPTAPQPPIASIP